jgi:hypothetical protein
VFAPSSGYDSVPINNSSDLALPPMDSYSFVNVLIAQLNSYGAGLESFLENLGGSVFAYEVKASTGVIAINNNQAVYDW